MSQYNLQSHQNPNPQSTPTLQHGNFNNLNQVTSPLHHNTPSPTHVHPSNSYTNNLSSHPLYHNTPIHHHASQHTNLHHNGTPSFERLTVDEIEKQFDKIAISIPSDFWKSPKPEDVYGLFSLALEEVFHLKMTDIRLEEFTGDVVNTFSESEGLPLLSYEGRLHQKAIGLLRFLRFCQHLCVNILGVTSFNRDFIYKPTPQTTLLFSTAFAHFLKFRDWIYTQHNDLFDELQRTYQEGHQFDEKILILEQDLSSFHNILGEMQSEIKERKQLFEQWREKLTKLNFQHAEITNQLAELDSHLNTLNTQEKEIIGSLGKAQIEREELKEQIIPHPEKFIQSEKDFKKRIQFAVRKINEKGKIIDELNQKLSVMEKAKKRLNNIETLMTTKLDPIFVLLHDERSKLKKTRQQIQELETSYVKYQKQQHQLSEAVRTGWEETKQRQREWNEQLERASYDFAQMEDIHYQRHEIMKTKTDYLHSLRSKCSEISENVLKLQEEHKSVLSTMEARFNEICECRNQFLNEIEKLRDSFPPGWQARDELERNEELEQEMNNLWDTSDNVTGLDLDELYAGVENIIDVENDLNSWSYQSNDPSKNFKSNQFLTENIEEKTPKITTTSSLSTKVETPFTKLKSFDLASVEKRKSTEDTENKHIPNEMKKEYFINSEQHL